MASKLITTHELTGVRVVGGKNGTKRIGKVRRFVFHPKEKRCVGFIVKRPDLLWMFRRKDKFVSIDGYDFEDGRIVIRNVPEATDRAACKALGVNWDDCVLWVGLPVMTEDGTSLGMVGNVTFNRITGMVDTFDTDSGATANALLGKRTIPADLVKGSAAEWVPRWRRWAPRRETDEWCWVRCWLTTRGDWFAEGGVAERPARSRPSPSTRCTPRWTGRSRWSAGRQENRRSGEQGRVRHGQADRRHEGMFSGSRRSTTRRAVSARFRRPGSGRDGRGGRRGRFRACEARVDRAQEEDDRQEARAQEEHVRGLQRGVRQGSPR
ncbi:MAG: PRC-barrel domain-containing protein [Eggerthella lenta]